MVERLGIHGLGFATEAAVRRFERALTQALRDERRRVANGPVALVQTGDVEALGAFPTSEDFYGYDYLQTLLDKLDVPAVSVYGNHDVWPGDFPLFKLRRPGQERQKEVLARRTHVKGPLPPPTALRLDTSIDRDLVIVPVSSVRSERIRGGLWSNGKLSPHPPDGPDPHIALVNLGLRPQDLNIIVQHHPVHTFPRSPASLKPSWIGELDDNQRVANTYSRTNIALVLAGHRHELDPPYNMSVNPGRSAQLPLGSRTSQLVALSATIAGHQAGLDAPQSGISVYRFIADIVSNTLNIQRAIYLTTYGAPLRALEEPATISDMPLR